MPNPQVCYSSADAFARQDRRDLWPSLNERMAGRQLSVEHEEAWLTSVVPPEMVARTDAAFQDFDWAEAELLELHTLFLRAARVVGDRSLDVPKSLRNQIATKLERAGVAPARTGSIKDLPRSGAQSAARSMVSRCRRDCCLVQSRMLNERFCARTREPVTADRTLSTTCRA